MQITQGSTTQTTQKSLLIIEYSYSYCHTRRKDVPPPTRVNLHFAKLTEIVTWDKYLSESAKLKEKYDWAIKKTYQPFRKHVGVKFGEHNIKKGILV